MSPHPKQPLSNPLLPPVDEVDGNISERMWPLDVALVGLGGLLIYIVLEYLPFNEPRLLYNGLTYVIAIPLITVGLSLGLRAIASRYVQKSIQLGFLVSVFVHLLLIIVAVRWVIFPHYFPEAFAGVKPERSPIRKTIPEYLFQKPDETNAVTPDWSKPVDAKTASRVVPREERKMPPVERSAPRLEVPRPSETPKEVPKKFLMKRAQPQASKPKPSDAPSKLARRRTPSEAMPQPASATPEAPAVQNAPAPAPDVAKAERPTSKPRKSNPKQSASVSMAASAPEAASVTPDFSPAPAIRRLADSMPKVGNAGLSPSRSQRRRPSRSAPAGAAPAPPSVAVAKLDISAERMVAPVETPLQRQSESSGAQIAPSQSSSSAEAILAESSDASNNAPQRSELASLAGTPKATAQQLSRPKSARRRSTRGSADAAGEAPDASDIAAMMEQASGEPSDDPSMDALASLAEKDTKATRQSQSRDSVSPNMASEADPMFDLMAPDGPAGLSKEFAEKAGILPSDEPVEMASMDLSRDKRAREEVGGPITPAGMAIAAVEQFSRRVQRTNGGAAPAPAGMVGPATEEAIERGLAYLASLQNEDGSWSLQGHGEDVLLQSDTAATGMCLLAFQGAGYTHRQHQYAATVAKGLEFLIENQKTNGNLYRAENRISDQNVGMYSHGISALALCEAYGMTQDSELEEPAQLCLDYIAATQHRRRGGWRYTPQVSSDTSVTGWMMMALKSGDLSGLEVDRDTYAGINRWLELAKVSPVRRDLYRYNPFAPNTPAQSHGRDATPTMTAVGILMRMYSGWSRDNPDMQSAADYILEHPPEVGTRRVPQRDTYYWYYATQVMFHMGGEYWAEWNRYLNPVLIDSQIKRGPESGSWDPQYPVPDRWSPHGGRLYVTSMNLLNLEVYYRHLPIYEETGAK